MANGKNLLRPTNLWYATEKLFNPDFTYTVVDCICDMINISYKEPTRGFNVKENVCIPNVYWAKIDGSTTCERQHALDLNKRMRELLVNREIELHNVVKKPYNYEADVFLLDNDKTILDISNVLKNEGLLFDFKPKQWNC